MYCQNCGSILQPDANFCGKCGRGSKSVGTTSGSSKYATPAPSRLPTFVWLLIGILCVMILGSLGSSLVPHDATHKAPERLEQKPAVAKSPDLTAQQVGSILFEHYMPSLKMLNAGIDVSSGRWYSVREGSAVNCEGDNCYYLEYAFQIVDAQGTAHDVKCEWDVDSHRRTATPRNEQARYYWTAAVPGWSK
jgi:zinc ribbon protein